MFVCRSAADAFAALTFPISTSEISIALERGSFCESEFDGSGCRGGGGPNESTGSQCYLNHLRSIAPGTTRPHRPAFIPQPAKPNLIMSTGSSLLIGGGEPGWLPEPAFTWPHDPLTGNQAVRTGRLLVRGLVTCLDLGAILCFLVYS